jgi:hypothetical protein
LRGTTDPDLSAGLRRRAAKPIPIKPIVGIAEERRLATIAALRDVVRNPRGPPRSVGWVELFAKPITIITCG